MTEKQTRKTFILTERTKSNREQREQEKKRDKTKQNKIENNDKLTNLYI